MDDRLRLTLAVLVLGLAVAPRAVVRASGTADVHLPLHLRWVRAALPDAVLPALSTWAETLPDQLCKLGPKNLTSLPFELIDQLCPAAAAAASPLAPRPATQDASILRLAAAPRTAGGAAALLAARGDVAAAARLQARLCGVFTDPLKSCHFKPSEVEAGAAAAAATAGGGAALPAAAGNYSAHLQALSGAPFWRGVFQAPSAKLRGALKWPAPGGAAREGGGAAAGGGGGGGDGGSEEEDSMLQRMVLAVWHRITALGDAKLAKARALLPPPVQPAARQLLESLPARLCEQPPESLAALPDAWKDAVCPFGLLASPLGALKAGLRPWGLVVAAAAFDASLALDGGGGGPGVSTSFDAAANATRAFLVGGSGGGEVEVQGDVDAAVARALEADPKFRGELNQERMTSWIAKMCALVYAPEMACNSSLKLPLAQHSSLDPVVQITRLLSSAPAGAADPALLRVDARRFGSVAALGAALGALPPARRAAEAETLRGYFESVPARIQAVGTRKGVMKFGWLTPFVCRVELKDFNYGPNGTSIWMSLNPVALAVRMALRLDEPAAMASALVGGKTGSGAMRKACNAIWDASEASGVPLVTPFDLEFKQWRACIKDPEMCGP